jgi:hypothetical protein
LDPVSGKELTPPRFDIVQRENNDMVFRLKFEPPLLAGEMVDYGFYVWTKNIYAMSKKEAVARYNDEWSRDGLNVNDPSLYLGLTVNFPAGFKYREARVEKDPVLTHDGPNVPGAVIKTFGLNQRTLIFEMEKPPTGQYFICWKPPE